MTITTVSHAPIPVERGMDPGEFYCRQCLRTVFLYANRPGLAPIWRHAPRRKPRGS